MVTHVLRGAPVLSGQPSCVLRVRPGHRGAGRNGELLVHERTASPLKNARQINPTYLRKKLGVVERQFDVPLSSVRLGVRGSVDEVLTLADGSMAPFDYKFAEDRGRVYLNQKMQSVLYGLMIRETFQVPVRRGFLCYLRSKHKVVELTNSTTPTSPRPRSSSARSSTSDPDRHLPRKPQRWKARCRDCCYRNICIQ